MLFPQDGAQTHESDYSHHVHELISQQQSCDSAASNSMWQFEKSSAAGVSLEADWTENSVLATLKVFITHNVLTSLDSR